MLNAQFSGQTKEKLSSRSATPFITSSTKTTVSKWLHQHIATGEKLAEFIIERAQKRIKTEKIPRKRVNSTGPALPGKLADCLSQEIERQNFFSWKAIQLVVLLNKLEIKIFKRYFL